MGRILEEGKKEIILPVLFYRVIDARDGTQSKAWFHVDYTISIWDEEPFQGDTLTLFESYHPKQGYQLRVYHVHQIDVDRGFSKQELTLNDNFSGLSTVKGKISKELSEDEVKEAILSHKFKILKDAGNGRLELPPVYEASQTTS